MTKFSISRREGLMMAAGLALAGPARAQDDDLRARALAIHKRVLVIDPHADVPQDFGVGEHEAAVDGNTQVDLPKLQRGGVDAVALCAFVAQGPRTAEGFAQARAKVDAKLAAIRAVPERHPDAARLALTASDIEAAKAEGKIAILPSFLNAYPFGTALTGIDDYHHAGVRLFGFVHSGNNDYADSSRATGDKPEEWGGLSPLGKAAVARLNDLGMLIDVSQLTRAGALQTVELSRAPVIATHSGLRGVVDTPRNLSDEELDAIKAKGGLVSVVAYNGYVVPPPANFAALIAPIRKKYGLPEAYERPTQGWDKLSPKGREDYSHEITALLPEATVSHVVDSIDYAVKRIGVDHVGVSSDFNHGGGVKGFANEGEAANVTIEMVRRGYSEVDIAKIWGGNFLRVFRQAQAGARTA